jgi:hypothetical protein
VEFPLDAENFHKHKDGSLSGVCKPCYRAQSRDQKKRAKVRRKQALQKIESSAVDIYAKLAQVGGSNVPHSAELVEKVCEYFGGVAGFAAIMVKQYYDSKPGSSTRNKMLETVCRLIQNNVDSGGAKKPLTLWTEEELEVELQERFRAAVLTHKMVIDAKEIEEAPDGDTAEDSEYPLDDPASSGPDQGIAGGIEGAGGGEPETLPTEPDAGENPQVPSE